MLLPEMEPQNEAGETRARDREWIDRQVADFQRGIGREECFERLHRRFHRPLRSFFARRLHSPEECLDLTQETFLRVYTGMEAFRGDCTFESWLFRIAYNTHLTWLRKKQASTRAKEIALGDVSPAEGGLGGSDLAAHPGDPDPLDLAVLSEERELLRRAVEELPEKMRRCLVLRIYREMSYQDIGAVMRIASDTVGAHLYQATKILRRRLPKLDLPGDRHGEDSE